MIVDDKEKASSWSGRTAALVRNNLERNNKIASGVVREAPNGFYCIKVYDAEGNSLGYYKAGV